MNDRQARRSIREAERNYSGRNVTRWYSTIHPRRNGEAVVKTWAVKTWKGKPLIMRAAEYPTDGSTPHVSGRCLINNTMNTKVFNWLDYGGKTHLAVWEDVDAARNEWLEGRKHSFGRGHEFFGLFLNGLEETRYRYCGWDNTEMRITDFLDCYHVSPMTELLAKAGLHRWLTPRHVGRLAESKPLARFVAKNRENLKSIPPIMVLREFRKHGEKADIEKMAALAELTPCGLTRLLKFAPKRIFAWMKRNDVTAGELRHHVDNLMELRMSTEYEPHVLPHDWATYSLEIDERVQEVRRMKAERERRIVIRARQSARNIIAKWMREGKIRESYKVVVPQSETEMVAEGNAMSNCVGGYFPSVRSGQCDLVFVRKFGKPYIDLEIREGKIRQMMYSHNREVKRRSADGRLCALLAKAFRRSDKSRKVA